MDLLAKGGHRRPQPMRLDRRRMAPVVQAMSSRTRRASVTAYDYGVKRNILRIFAERGCRLTVVPADTCRRSAAMSPDGIFLSNGPGDPEPCDYAIAAISGFSRHPDFPICLGHQLMALARAPDHEDEVRHHGRTIRSGSRYRPGGIPARNHGFAVDPQSCRPTGAATFRCSTAFAGACRTDAGFLFQGHEASPGPHDVAYLSRPLHQPLEERK